MAASPFSFSPSRSFPPLRSFVPAMARSFSSSSPKHNGDDPQEPSLSNLEIVGARRALLSSFASLKKPYKPFPLIAWNRHVETIFAAFFRSVPDVALRRECLRTSDDGAVALDWVSGDDRRLPFDSPVLILLVRSRF